ncbi:MAG: ABC transporter substrate-binding protein [Lachnospiraceae bacterium]|nr:ABC transporter substrate-binding protein [Lachnospiraceae bacterium]
MKRKIITMLTAAVATLCLAACGQKGDANTLTVINYGEYIDPDVLKSFTDETGIEVLYEEALTPEEMYTKYMSGAIDYDLLCTSDYMVKRLIDEGEAQPVDFASMENAGNIGDEYWKFSEAFDPGNKYSLPYFYGTVGLLYDTTKVKEPIDSWEVLFNGQYKNDIIMQNSQRDTFMVTLKYLGYSLNTTSEEELREAKDLLQKQKPDVQAYLVDEARDEVVAGNAAMAVVYSGEAYLGHEYNEDLAYVVPKEGSNVWIDSWVVTKKCKNTEAAAKFLDYLCRDDIAYKNFEYIYYSTPNEAAVEMMPDELKNNPAIVPTKEDIANCEVCTQTDEATVELYNELWKELKSTD